ncbi:MAG TPA: ABC transporter ATP-binding protein [Candidatus Sumerlaeota bacterium]|nr:MAG: putative ABC transporter ATP-binding protein YxlF [candidate division BRC1 bacterium ADurb.BinA292]HOE97406.1 ABC transporter ATP-binding protein [Candidatus Sumerlaeota bacterium]HPK03181.1 ABC transporter ATP-binding protein [Candidatus Sumerlaeota bacterium]
MGIIETEGLTKIYVRDVIDTEFGRLRIRLTNRKTVALQDLSLDVQQGEIFGLLGPNGAGKTTAIKILMGIHFPTSGSARLMGKPLGDREVKKRIGFLPENPYFYDYLKGWEFLDFYGQLYGMDKKTRRRKIERLLDQVGLTHAADRPLRGYSKGMNQRIGLAQALMNDPEIVFLDEPQSGLDPLGRKEVRDIIVSLRDEGKTVFFSSHILSDAEMICDRVAILYRGKLQSLGTLGSLLSQSVRDWEIVLRGVSDEFMDRWRPRLVRLEKSDGDFWVIAKEEATTHELIREATAAGGVLIQLLPRRESLEDYFIRQVQGSPEPRGAAA